MISSDITSLQPKQSEEAAPSEEVKESEKEQVDYVCGFIRAFQGSVSSTLASEMMKNRHLYLNKKLANNCTIDLFV